jgi:hypothetical protein
MKNQLTQFAARSRVLLQRLVRQARFNRYTLFAVIVWRPTTGDRGDTWLQAWRKYRLDAKTAWQIACGIHAERKSEPRPRGRSSITI